MFSTAVTGISGLKSYVSSSLGYSEEQNNNNNQVKDNNNSSYSNSNNNDVAKNVENSSNHDIKNINKDF